MVLQLHVLTIIVMEECLDQIDDITMVPLKDQWFVELTKIVTWRRREGEREGGREGERKRGREGGREGERERRGREEGGMITRKKTKQKTRLEKIYSVKRSTQMLKNLHTELHKKTKTL